MSLFNTNKDKGKKKGGQPKANPGPVPKGKGQTKPASKHTRLTGRAQRGS